MSGTSLTAAVIQARVGSSRLPGKVLRKLGDASVLTHVIRRVRKSGVASVVVATSALAQDDPIEKEALAAGALCFRGSETDVLGRFDGAANRAKADVVVRVTADCPFYDGNLLGRMLEDFKRRSEGGSPVDYLSNCIVRRFPRGLDTEIFTARALSQAAAEATAEFEREHVTPYIYGHPEKFRIGSFTNEEDLSLFRWTLDTEDDWRFTSAVYDELFRPGQIFSTEDVLELLRKRPDIIRLNGDVQQKPVGDQRRGHGSV